MTGVQAAQELVAGSKLWKPDAQTAAEQPLAVLLLHSRHSLTDVPGPNPKHARHVSPDHAPSSSCEWPS